MRPIIALVTRNLIKLSRDKMKLFFTFFMSGMLLFIFSFVTKSMVLDLEHPLNYLISGIIIMTVFQSSLNNSMSILEDISSGFMKEILVAPIKRWQIAIGQVLSSAIVAIIQGLIIIVAGLFMGLNIDLFHSVLVIILMSLVGLTSSALGLYLAAIAKDSTNFQLLITILTFPLTFLSGAYIPIMALPKVIIPIVYLNPLTYATAAFRYVVLNLETLSSEELIKMGINFPIGGFVITPLLSTFLIIVLGTLFFVLCVNKFNSADFSRVKVSKQRGHR
ncbi:MAG: ABC transporter permease [Melioribacteraceae bacterium]